MKSTEPSAVEVLTGVTSSPRASTVREHVPGKFPPHVESRIRENVRAGMDRKMAEEIVNRDMHGAALLQQGCIEAMTNILPALQLLSKQLAPFFERGDLSPAESLRQDQVRREAALLLPVANEVAQRFFTPFLAEKRRAAQEQVKDLAGGDATRAADMAEHHWDVVRLKEFICYVDSLGNCVEKRLALFIEFFGEAVATPNV